MALGSLKGATLKETLCRTLQQCSEVCGLRHGPSPFSFNAFARFLHRPCDPASLAATRIMFGVLMALDVLQERGMSVADVKWGDSSKCRFPLLEVLHPLPLPYMVVLYAVMFICSVMMALGLLWRASCSVFVASYWYLFLLDKSSWNNHSYLYGLLSFILLLSDPHRCWSLDGMTKPGIRNSHVPFWSYAVLRTQVFLLYFLAGIKKLDPDWLLGYSMQNLSEHWVFSVFRPILSNNAIDYFIIHLGGFTLDLTIGLLLLCDSTRKPALFFGSAFHLMNSQIFSIGMFPWVCIATLPIFCNLSWPRPLLSSFQKFLLPLRTLHDRFIASRQSSDEGPSTDDDATTYSWSSISRQEKIRLYTSQKLNGAPPPHHWREGKSVSAKGTSVVSNIREQTTSVTGTEGSNVGEVEQVDKQTTKVEEKNSGGREMKIKEEQEDMLRTLQRNRTCVYSDDDQEVTVRQKVTSVLIVAYLCLQLFLPFSHFITKGYNTWTEGPYGYSWDMMVHSWDTLHVKITVVKLDTGKKFYIDPNVYVNNGRWTSHVDMAVQYGRCIESRLRDHGYDNISLHFDVWRSLNRRFQQRVYDPSVDILTAPWSPWEKTPWVLPVLVELSQWRDKLRELQEGQTSPYSDRIFVADFPGMMLENFLSEDLSNVTIEVLHGEVRVLVPVVEGGPATVDHEEGEKEAEEELTQNETWKVVHLDNTVEIANDSCHSQKGEENVLAYGGCFPKDSDEDKDLKVRSVVLRAGESMALPSGTFHSVITTSATPSSYMYNFVNTTIQKQITGNTNNERSGTPKPTNMCSNHITENYFTRTSKKATLASESKDCKTKLDETKPSTHTPDGDKNVQSYQHESGASGMPCGVPTVWDLVKFVRLKLAAFYRSVRLLRDACRYIVAGIPMDIAR
ncbi:vitamin K-dependent gamma-carboxylase-like [Penaeus chinensis]|uniref:vitamin K-dependent gamma-carboxylase-like n=1 Tax=Penaeus chinensis TaxID=139456 RepID=UPI001FB75002|nr:vitamin K-dependent gamma-carboxylase-like [Penaeus chinensis]